MSDNAQVEAVVAAVKSSKKYQDTSEETIRELATAALRHYKRPKQAIKAVRGQLHSIMAPYLGDPDYRSAANQLDAAFASNDAAQVSNTCLDLMRSHLSTRERLPILTEFYLQIFETVGQPSSILDVACGLNPLAFPWMGLAPPIHYYAYDIHEPRVELLNHYFALQGLPQLARLQDVSIRFPQEQADIALFLKEMPRFERNYGRLGRPLLEALQVRHVVISFPTISQHGGRNLTGRYRDYFHELIQGHPWSATELLFEGELVFCVDKGNDRKS
jgi:16S rRNA (guanine(1405)-N(7))-methyltransferase